MRSNCKALCSYLISNSSISTPIHCSSIGCSDPERHLSQVCVLSFLIRFYVILFWMKKHFQKIKSENCIASFNELLTVLCKTDLNILGYIYKISRLCLKIYWHLFLSFKNFSEITAGGRKKKRTPERLKVNTHHRLGPTTNAVFAQCPPCLRHACYTRQDGKQKEMGSFPLPLQTIYRSKFLNT